MSMVVRALLAVLIVLIQDTQSATWKYSCPKGWTYYSGSCFTLIKDKQPWPIAQEFCELMRANLATISDSKENNVLTNLVRQATSNIHTQAWTGLHDQVVEGRFTWIQSNLEARWSHWARQPEVEPNNKREDEDCVSLRPDGYWNDAPCALSMMFICELNL